MAEGTAGTTSAPRQPEATSAERTKTALVLSAGAPHSPLMAGVLTAFYERGVKFDVIHTSGAGTLIGLLFVAPKGRSPVEALRAIVDLGVSDYIYRFFPIGYKAFFKPGPLTQPIHRWAQQFKLGAFPLGPIENPVTPIGRAYNTVMERLMTARGGEIKRLYNDLVDMWAATITPTTLTPWSKGVSPPLPFLDDLVDFDKLRNFPGEFYANAFSTHYGLEGTFHVDAEGQKHSGLAATAFSKTQLTPAHVRAAFAFPFVYESVWIGKDMYFEGADRDPINFGSLISLDHREGDGDKEIKTVVLIDILASLQRHLLRPPRNLWDAYGLSIMAPVVANAMKECVRFQNEIDAGHLPYKFLRLTFDECITEEEGAHLTEWRYSNLSRMFQIGLDRGRRFWDEHRAELPTY